MFDEIDLELAHDVTFGTVELNVETEIPLPKGVIAKVNFDPLMWLDAPTPDGRYFASAGFELAGLPSFLQYKDATGGAGHDGARVCGSLRHVETDPLTGKVSGWGYLIDNQAGHDCLLALTTRAVKGVSADLRGCALSASDTEALGVRQAFSRSQLAGATICPMPAFPDTEVTVDTIVASGTLVRDLKPPRDAFSNPRLSRPTGIRVVPLNAEFEQVFGHLCLWNQPHVSITGKKVYPPRDDDLSKFYTGGTVLCADGSAVRVGRLFLGGEHADVSLSAQQALDAYAATCTAWADVRVGKDEHGIWVAGVTRPGISEELAYAGRASALSGDWRPIGGRRRLVAALSCNFPGFPVYEDGEGLALIASGPPPETDDEVEGVEEGSPVEEVAAEPLSIVEEPTAVALEEVEVRSYVRNGRMVRGYKRRVEGGRGLPGDAVDAVREAIAAGLQKPKPIGKITPKGPNRAAPDQAITVLTSLGAIEVRLRQNPRTKEVRVEVRGGSAESNRRIQERVVARLDKWIAGEPRVLWEKIKGGSKDGRQFDPTLVMSDKAWHSDVEQMVTDEVYAYEAESRSESRRRRRGGR